MAQIPAGYKLLLQRPNGDIFWDLDLGEYDLTKSVAKASVIGEISEQLDMELANLNEGGDSH